MKAFEGYDEVKVNNFGERLSLGGHICKVLEAKIEQLESKKDGKKYEQLVIKFDIEAPDEQAGFYADIIAALNIGGQRVADNKYLVLFGVVQRFFKYRLKEASRRLFIAYFVGNEHSVKQ